MDNTSEARSGQQNVNAAVDRTELLNLLELVQLLRAWWEKFESKIRDLDRDIAINVHDIFIEAVISARALARRMGIALPDFSTYNWAPSIPAEGRGGSDL